VDAIGGRISGEDDRESCDVAMFTDNG
jgi:hypothetical protein